MKAPQKPTFVIEIIWIIFSDEKKNRPKNLVYYAERFRILWIWDTHFDFVLNRKNIFVRTTKSVKGGGVLLIRRWWLLNKTILFSNKCW